MFFRSFLYLSIVLSFLYLQVLSANENSLFKENEVTREVPCIFSLIEDDVYDHTRRDITPAHTGNRSNSLQLEGTFNGEVNPSIYRHAKLGELKTAVEQALITGDLTRVKYLVNVEKVPADVPDRSGMTLFLRAAMDRHFSLMSFFYQTGQININRRIPLENGGNLFHLAARTNDVSLAGWLFFRNANRSLTDRQGRTPLLVASQHNSIDFLDVILEYPIDVNATDSNKDTALHIASRNHFPDVAQRLLRFPGIIINPINLAGQTPYSIAVEEGHLTLVQQIQDRSNRT